MIFRYAHALRCVRELYSGDASLTCGFLSRHNINHEGAIGHLVSLYPENKFPIISLSMRSDMVTHGAREYSDVLD
jgi:hypothetical protein